MISAVRAQHSAASKVRRTGRARPRRSQGYSCAALALAGGCGVQNGDWVDNQRIKQYATNVESPSAWGPVRNYDADCADYATSPGGVNVGECG